MHVDGQDERNTGADSGMQPDAGSREQMYGQNFGTDQGMQTENGRQDQMFGQSTGGRVDPNNIAKRTRMVATLGVMAAISVILLVLGTLISINTVFFTAAASFLVGIAVVKYKFGAGLMIFLGCAVLDLLLNPDKFHVFLYLAMGGFILFGEGTYKLLEKQLSIRKNGPLFIWLSAPVFLRPVMYR
ncbi:MAG: hypothetical protein J5819_10245 [Eubacterium sp.]|nr:hypothetical protein [Eubacterium sp.]